MSHFTTVRTQFNDLDALCKALDRLKFRYERGNATVRGYMGNTLKAPVSVKLTPQYDVGFQLQPDGTYQMIADWWGIEHHMRQQDVIESITRHYAAVRTIDTLEAEGYVYQEEVEPDGSIRISAQQWS